MHYLPTYSLFWSVSVRQVLSSSNTYTKRKKICSIQDKFAVLKRTQREFLNLPGSQLQTLSVNELARNGRDCNRNETASFGYILVLYYLAICIQSSVQLFVDLFFRIVLSQFLTDLLLYETCFQIEAKKTNNEIVHFQVRRSGRTTYRTHWSTTDDKLDASRGDL